MKKINIQRFWYTTSNLPGYSLNFKIADDFLPSHKDYLNKLIGRYDSADDRIHFGIYGINMEKIIEDGEYIEGVDYTKEDDSSYTFTNISKEHLSFFKKMGEFWLDFTNTEHTGLADYENVYIYFAENSYHFCELEFSEVQEIGEDNPFIIYLNDLTNLPILIHPEDSVIEIVLSNAVMTEQNTNYGPNDWCYATFNLTLFDGVQKSYCVKIAPCDMGSLNI